MSRSRLFPCLGLGFLLATTLGACASTPVPAADQPTDARPIGYLQDDELPDGLALIPPPPAAGSTWAALDDAIAREALALQGSPRFRQAGIDADLDFPDGANQFGCALGVPVDARHTPALQRLLQRSLIDAARATRAAKDHYRRPRPFLANGQPTCTPDKEAHMRDSGSYPSGHAAIGWTWALVLSEVAPQRATALLRRGHDYAQSRLVCNVHWYSDVQQSQLLAAATVARLHDNLQFSADLLLAQRELEKARDLDLPLPRDCGAEASALETGLSEAR